MTDGLTPALMRALRVVSTLTRPANSRDIARLLYPDSPGWTRPSNCGSNGAMTGKGPTIVAARLLRRLQALGLIYQTKSRYQLTEQGRTALNQEERAQTKRPTKTK